MIAGTTILFDAAEHSQGPRLARCVAISLSGPAAAAAPGDAAAKNVGMIGIRLDDYVRPSRETNSNEPVAAIHLARRRRILMTLPFRMALRLRCWFLCNLMERRGGAGRDH